MMLNLDSVPQRLCFKATREKFAELIENEDIVPAPYVGRYKWVMLERFDILHEEALEDLIRQSYEMVAAKLPRTAHRSKPAKPSKRKRRTGKAHR
jgi:predicted DNA-binding protein (MmcQ/YjbR family)